MHNQQSQTLSQIINFFNFILNAPLLDQIEQKALQKLINLIMRNNFTNILLKVIKKTLKNTQEVILRLKVLCILHELLIRQNLKENIELTNSILSDQQNRMKRQDKLNLDIKNMKTYLQINVQLPYLIFLRKILMWHSADITDDDTKHIDIGFCLINKMKDIINLKKIFNHYGCYFSTHKYALNMFKASLSSIKKLWIEICHLVKNITLQALKTNTILKEQYIFICAAEEIQDLLIEYVYYSQFSKKINQSYKIKYIVLLKPQIKALEQQRKRSESEQQIIKCLKEKRESRRHLDKQNEKHTGYSDNVDQSLNTEMQIQILDSILRLQSLLSQPLNEPA